MLAVYSLVRYDGSGPGARRTADTSANECRLVLGHSRATC